MSSPFPGMDPYLEGSMWSTVHGQLTAEIARQLAPRIPPKYLALMEKRFVTWDPTEEAENGVFLSALAGEREAVYPDVGVVQTGSSPDASLAGSLLEAPLELATIMPELLGQHFIEIRDTAGKRLVTVIEVLSPANKVGRGHREYLARRTRLLSSDVHLLEIDLLRTGKPPPMHKPLPDAPYFVFACRARRRPMTGVWPINLSEPLPTVPVPLLPGDPDVSLELQTAFNNIYDLLGYGLAVDYSKPPEIALTKDQWSWAQQRLGASR